MLPSPAVESKKQGAGRKPHNLTDYFVITGYPNGSKKDKKVQCRYCALVQGGQRKTCRSHLKNCNEFAVWLRNTQNKDVLTFLEESDRVWEEKTNTKTGHADTMAVQTQKLNTFSEENRMVRLDEMIFKLKDKIREKGSQDLEWRFDEVEKQLNICYKNISGNKKVSAQNKRRAITQGSDTSVKRSRSCSVPSQPPLHSGQHMLVSSGAQDSGGLLQYDQYTMGPTHTAPAGMDVGSDPILQAHTRLQQSQVHVQPQLQPSGQLGPSTIYDHNLVPINSSTLPQDNIVAQGGLHPGIPHLPLEVGDHPTTNYTQHPHTSSGNDLDSAKQSHALVLSSTDVHAKAYAQASAQQRQADSVLAPQSQSPGQIPTYMQTSLHTQPQTHPGGLQQLGQSVQAMQSSGEYTHPHPHHSLLGMTQQQYVVEGPSSVFSQLQPQTQTQAQAQAQAQARLTLPNQQQLSMGAQAHAQHVNRVSPQEHPSLTQISPAGTHSPTRFTQTGPIVSSRNTSPHALDDSSHTFDDESGGGHAQTKEVDSQQAVLEQHQQQQHQQQQHQQQQQQQIQQQQQQIQQQQQQQQQAAQQRQAQLAQAQAHSQDQSRVQALTQAQTHAQLQDRASEHQPQQQQQQQQLQQLQQLQQPQEQEQDQDQDQEQEFQSASQFDYLPPQAYAHMYPQQLLQSHEAPTQYYGEDTSQPGVESRMEQANDRQSISPHQEPEESQQLEHQQLSQMESNLDHLQLRPQPQNDDTRQQQVTQQITDTQQHTEATQQADVQPQSHVQSQAQQQADAQQQQQQQQHQQQQQQQQEQHELHMQLQQQHREGQERFRQQQALQEHQQQQYQHQHELVQLHNDHEAFQDEGEPGLDDLPHFENHDHSLQHEHEHEHSLIHDSDLHTSEHNMQSHDEDVMFDDLDQQEHAHQHQQAQHELENLPLEHLHERSRTDTHENIMRSLSDSEDATLDIPEVMGDDVDDANSVLRGDELTGHDHSHSHGMSHAPPHGPQEHTLLSSLTVTANR